MRILDKTVIFDGAQSSRGSLAAFPAICKLQSGNLVATWQVGINKHHSDCSMLVSVSGDMGKTWSEPIEPFRSWAAPKLWTVNIAYVTEVSPGRILASLLVADRTKTQVLPLYNPDTEGSIPMYLGLSESLDGGRSWSEPRVLSAGDLSQYPTNPSNYIQRATDGRLLLPFETQKSWDDTGVWQQYAACLVSKDDGATWDEVVITAHDPTNRYLYWDHRPICAEGNRCVDFYWLFDGEVGREVEARRKLSTDGGATWPGEPVGTGLDGQPWPVYLGGDRLLLLLIDRYGDAAIKAYNSEDLGESWLDEMVVYKHEMPIQNAANLTDNLAQQFKWSYGLASGTKISDNEVMAVYYRGTPEATMIECAQIVL